MGGFFIVKMRTREVLDELEKAIDEEIVKMRKNSLNESSFLGPDLVDAQYLFTQAQLILHANGELSFHAMPGEIVFPEDGLIPEGTTVRILRNNPIQKNGKKK